MIGPEVQKAVFDALMQAPALAAGRVFDRVPELPDFPYVSFGSEQVLDDGNTCDDGWEVFSDIHVWSRAVGYVEAKQLVADVVDRINTISAIGGHALISVVVEDTRMLRDPDGLTSHGIVAAKFIITPA
jgi:hypothetical protein